MTLTVTTFAYSCTAGPAESDHSTWLRSSLSCFAALEQQILLTLSMTRTQVPTLEAKRLRTRDEKRLMSWASLAMRHYQTTYSSRSEQSPWSHLEASYVSHGIFDLHPFSYVPIRVFSAPTDEELISFTQANVTAPQQDVYSPHKHGRTRRFYYLPSS
ncbi:hypothetical protein EDD22DRAFT_852217 [Suillus occidentalis]|nr:hypothetical protein EDD22DRAFT_852217 [Suillus occidentalis]